MKSFTTFVVILIFGEVSVNSSVRAQLASKCTDDNFLEVDIPYPNKRTAKILHMKSGICDQDNYALKGGEFEYDENSSIARMRLPIDQCELNTEPKCENSVKMSKN